MIPYLLDTNICVELIRERSERLLRRIGRQSAGSVGISTVTLAELRYGVARSSNPSRNMLALARFCVPMRIVPFDARAADEYGVLRVSLESEGKPIGPLDMLIAAHALSLQAVLVTNNEREFRRVNGLMVENWLM